MPSDGGPTDRDDGGAVSVTDDEAMHAAIAAASRARRHASPNPWVGAVVVHDGRIVADGATEAPGGRHAEVCALDAAGEVRGATVVVTLEPCNHQGRTGPCAQALIEAGIARVVVGLQDPDPQVAGSGISRLEEAGIDVAVGVQADAVERQLAPYLAHRRTGRPWVVLKLAASLDGRTAAPDGSSQWITGEEARRDAHRLRAESDAVVVGAGTVRADDPALTVRHVDGDDPRRVVLGAVPDGARVAPALSWTGPLPDLLEHLGREDVVQVLVEGGARVARSFHAEGLVDRYVLYLAPTLFGGDDAHPMFAGAGAATMGDRWRGQVVDVQSVGPDLRIELEAA